jgi:Photosynthesis system II assembly factor YCF48/Putative zinc-finger
MQKVPKVVVKRLQSPPAESHPDADLLTAFAEKSLTGAERDHVVEHLARCGDCREVVSLALPPQVESQPLADSAGWFRWTLLRGSALRWAAVAAGVVLIASIGTLQYRSQRPRELASNVFQAKPAIATPAQSSQPASQMAVPQAGMQEEKGAAARPQTDLARNKRARLDGTIVLPGADSALANRAVAGPVVRSAPSPDLSLGQRQDSVLGGTPAPPPAAGQNPVSARSLRTVEVAGASPVVEVQSETSQVASQPTAQSQTQDQSETAEQSADRVAKAKAASAQVSTALAPPSLHSAPMLMKAVAMPRWTISASGVLQRSLDGGQTWLDVNVAAKDSTTFDFARRTKAGTTVEVAANALKSAAQPEAVPPAPPAPSVNAPSVNAKSMKKQSAPAVPLTFRALSVSSNAAEVWAGGLGGALYHTTDGGNHWTRVVPSVAGTILTGDVLSIQFSDSRIGTVTTSTSEIWTTPDAGQTWQKQP